MEIVINERRIKYEDNEWYYWYYKQNNYHTHFKKPYWRKFKLSKTGREGYNYHKININKKPYYVHRLLYKLYHPEWDINDVSKNNQIDHIDRDRLNNNISNLRILSSLKNNQNTKGKGYYYDKERDLWQVQICVNYKKIFGGRFKTEEEAIKKRAELKIKYHTI